MTHKAFPFTTELVLELLTERFKDSYSVPPSWEKENPGEPIPTYTAEDIGAGFEQWLARVRRGED